MRLQLLNMKMNFNYTNLMGVLDIRNEMTEMTIQYKGYSVECMWYIKATLETDVSNPYHSL